MNKQKQGFTLVELIVVITILAILGTIAILAFSGYSKNARDSARLSDISNMKKSLELWILQSGSYPEPSSGTGITYSGSTVWNQGTFGETVYNTIGKLDKKPKDPLYDVEYTYSVTNTKKEYQIGAVLEKNISGTSIFPQTYAATSGEAYTSGTYNGILTTIGTNTLYILALPSIILSDLSVTNLGVVSGSSMVYEGKSNLPSSYEKTGLTMTGSDFSFTPTVVWSGVGMSELNNQTQFQSLVTSLQNAYTDPLFASMPQYTKIASEGATIQDAMGFVKGYIETNYSQTLSNVTIPEYVSCMLDGQEITHNGSITAYSENNILWNAAYACSDKEQTRTCTNGVLSGESTYQYGNCVKGTPTNCSANGSYTFNAHTYSIPGINHGQQALSIYTSNIAIANGTKKYLLESIACNDGVLINEQEQINPEITCTTNFHSEDNASCISDTRSNQACTNLPTNGLYYNSTTSYQVNQTYGGSWSPSLDALAAGYAASPTSNTCQWKCAAGYTQSGNTCAQSLICNSGEDTSTGVCKDPYWNNVVYLSHFDNNYNDVLGNTGTISGVINLSSSSKIGSGALFLDGSNAGEGFTTNANSNIILGTNPFTLEFYLSMTSPLTVKHDYILHYGDSTTAATAGCLGIHSWEHTYGDGNKLVINYNSSYSVLLNSQFVPIANQWYHIAIVRDASNNSYFFVDGILKSKGTGWTQNLTGNKLRFGGADGNNLWGKIDEFRITKGVSRYVGTTVGQTYFTPPVQAFPHQ